jgi:chemotaxis protein methyltransferase CheR
MTARWTSAGFRRVAELVRERSGLIFPDARVPDVEAAARRQIARHNLPDVESLLDVLRDDEEARDAFVAELTIGETYFLRDPDQLDLLRSRILPELLQTRTKDRPVRVWSAGCASGEEPYSVAMLFDGLQALDRADVIGTDIARTRLEDAQRGLYPRWSLRSVPDAVRERYFTPRGRYFELDARIRAPVDFRYLNLAEDAFPSLSTGIWGMDVILCRNVLIYFDPPTIERVARRLLASLSEDGWLILGASDPAIAEIVKCDVVLTDAGLVYRRVGAAVERDLRLAPALAEYEPPRPQLEPEPEPEPDVAAAATDFFAALAAASREYADAARSDAASRERAGRSPARPLTEEPADADAASDAAVVAAYRARDYPRVRQLAEAAHERHLLGAAGAIAWLRALANEGCLEEAARVAAAAGDRVGPSAELLYLHAVLMLHGARNEEAAALSRRALYLERDMVVAHLTLAEALRRTGDVERSRRALRNAAALLERLPQDTIVPASDGETAGRLNEMTRTRLRLLAAAA